MPRTIHAALVRVYRSRSSYGAVPFSTPLGSPKIVEAAGEMLELHFGSAPEWLKNAIGRSPIVADALLRAMFQSDPVQREALDGRLTAAEAATLAEPDDKWLTCLVLRKQVLWEDDEVSDAPWFWWTKFERLHATEKDMKARIASLDLAARVVASFVPNVFDAISVRDRVFVARDSNFSDAFGMPNIEGGEMIGSMRSSLERIESFLSTPEFERVLVNAISAPAFPADSTRPNRFKAALRSDLFLDDGGSYGRYELLREMQPVLMRATTEQPLAAMFIDMNGLKAINDDFGHDAGDAAIAEFRDAVRSEHKGTLFRTGGDEFVIFALGAAEETIAIARQLLKAIRAREVAGRRLSASIGIVLARDPLEAPRAIISRADKEMYRAKGVSRVSTPRRCTLAIEDSEVFVVDD